MPSRESNLPCVIDLPFRVPHYSPNRRVGGKKREIAPFASAFQHRTPLVPLLSAPTHIWLRVWSRLPHRVSIGHQLQTRHLTICEGTSGSQSKKLSSSSMLPTPCTNLFGKGLLLKLSHSWHSLSLQATLLVCCPSCQAFTGSLLS